jgi:hypothetical protein
MENSKTSNLFLSFIEERPNVECNNSKAYSDFTDISEFERYYNTTANGILLAKTHFHPEGDRIFTPLGIYTNLTDFAERLRREVPEDKKVFCALYGGSKLEFTVFSHPMSAELPTTYETEFSIVAQFMEVNQRSSDRHHESL